MSSINNRKKLVRSHVGELPILEAFVKKLNLRSILDEFLPQRKKEEFPPSSFLILLIYNLIIGKAPLYELEEWVQSLELKCIDQNSLLNCRFTDDRFGKALDRLYGVDRASLMTRIVIEAIKIFDIDLRQLHNDSTTVSAFGSYPGKTSTGFELKKGRSKDSRPDLKQLVFSLSISADGAIPIHFKVYPGNRNDDTTHIETWDTLFSITQDASFLYVGDSKLCTDKQLSYITEKGGRALAPVPDSWGDVKSFKAMLKNAHTKLKKKEIWRRKQEGDSKIEYFSVIDKEHLTTIRGYKIHWIHSSERQAEDVISREKRLSKAEKELAELLPKINKRKLKKKKEILNKCNEILMHRDVGKFIKIIINKSVEKHIIKKGKGRPSKKTKYKISKKRIFTLSWVKDKAALKADENLDGLFPLLCTDPSLSPREAIMAFKFQPRLEKRFTHLKSTHNIAPLLFKKLERVEANMFLFFVALLLQSLIEREIRLKMKNQQIKSLQIYPECRDALHPTTAKVFDIFGGISTYKIFQNESKLEEYADELNDVHASILELLSIEQETYWKGIT